MVVVDIAAGKNEANFLSRKQIRIAYQGRKRSRSGAFGHLLFRCDQGRNGPLDGAFLDQQIAQDVTVTDRGEVIVAGAVSDDQGIFGVPLPAYWKNNALTMLSMSPLCGTVKTDCYKGSIATGVATEGSDLYVAGYAGYTDPAGEQYMVPVIWKNGSFTALPIDTENGLTAQGNSKVKVSDGNVYVFGALGENNVQTYPASWKNGQLTVLRDAKGIFSDGALQSGSVYGTGYYNTEAKGYANPALWKDGVMTPLSMLDAGLIGVASGIQYLDGNQYISGYNFYLPDENDPTIYSRPSYWTNGVRTDLTAPPFDGTSSADDATMTSQAPGMYLYQQWKVDAQGDPQWKGFIPYLGTQTPGASAVVSHALTTGIAVVTQ